MKGSAIIYYAQRIGLNWDCPKQNSSVTAMPHKRPQEVLVVKKRKKKEVLVVPSELVQNLPISYH